MAVIQFPNRTQSPRKTDDPATHLLKTAATAAITSGLDRRTAAAALRRVAAALDRRQG